MPSPRTSEVRRSNPPGEPRASFAASASLVSESAPQAPERYGKYHLLERIGIGGMAEVWRAKTLGSEGFTKDLVIKRILPKFTGDEESVRMFIDEARLVAKLHHPNIVHIFDFDKDIYGAEIEVEFVKPLRMEKKFDSLEALKSQLAYDRLQALEILKND